MTPKETVEWANAFIKAEVFPTIRELSTGKKIQFSENDSLLRNTLMLARLRLEEKAEAEKIDLQGTEVVLFPQMIGEGKVIINMMAVTKEEADLIREELSNREIRRKAAEEKKDEKDELPN